jgi:2-methylcitrate dehydratase PrpD
MAPMSDYLDALVDFVDGTRLDDVPAAARAHLRAIFADTLVAFAAGMQQPEMKALAARQVAESGGGHAMIVGTGQRCGPIDAAALNATAGCWLEIDEGNLEANGHPGIQVLPAALAVAQQRGASGRAFLEACAIGYEVAGRIGSACDQRMIVHPHGTYGVVGAAVAVAKLCGLPRERMRELISLAGSSPLAGNRMTMKDGATLRNWYAAHSAQMGQMAVRLIEAGFTAPHDGLAPTCNQILFDNFRPDAVVAGLGRRWLLGDGYIKLYPCGRPVHAAIDALRDALARSPRPVLPTDVARIEVRAFQFAAFLDRTDIRNAFATRFSTPFALASVLFHGSHGLECFDEAAAANPVILDLARRVDLTEDAGYTAAWPTRQPCDVVLVMNDGSRLAGHCEVMRGEPSNPVDRAEFQAKFMAIGAPIWGEAMAGRIHAAALAVDEAADMRGFAGSPGI